MNAITLVQPRATLVTEGVLGVIPLRHHTDHRGVVAVHASAATGTVTSPAAAAVEVAETLTGSRFANWPRGAIVGTVEVVDVVPIVAADRADSVDRCVAVDPDGFVEAVGVGRDVDDHVLGLGGFEIGGHAWFVDDPWPVRERCPACAGRGDHPIPEHPPVTVVCRACLGDGKDPKAIRADGGSGLWDWVWTNQ